MPLPDNRDDQPYRSPLARNVEPVETPRIVRKWDWTVVVLNYIALVALVGGWLAHEVAKRVGTRPPGFMVEMFFATVILLGYTFSLYILVVGTWRMRLAALPGMVAFFGFLWSDIAFAMRWVPENLARIIGME